MEKNYYKQLEEHIRKNLAQRGLDGIALSGELEGAAASLLKSETVIIVTGFVIRAAMSGETDGPIGAVSLASALERLGKKAVFVTDEYSADMLNSCVSILGLRCPIEVIFVGSEEFFCKKLLKRYRPTHIIGIERPGRTEDGRCCSMRGEDLSDIVPNTDILFQKAKQQEITTIAIGDGGNEVGMGKIKPYVMKAVYKGSEICAAVSTDLLILAGVSNWGGHALSAALSILSGSMLLYDTATEERLLESIVQVGAVDGCTKLRTMTVDGLSLEENLNMLHLLRSTAEAAIERL